MAVSWSPIWRSWPKRPALETARDAHRPAAHLAVHLTDKRRYGATLSCSRPVHRSISKQLHALAQRKGLTLDPQRD